MKKLLSRLKPVFLLMIFSVICVSLTSVAIGAAAKDCTFYHGQNKCYGFGQTKSSTLERELMNRITVSFTDINKSYTNEETSNNSQYCVVWTDSLEGHSGSHIVHYYVNGSLAHNSTAPWPFDCR